ncbi:MAG: hypothetical protein P1P93_00980 [Gammaproteobacteria bacterium]|nr:hypothetical protein [Gammaproteobacteria bacterium]
MSVAIYGVVQTFQARQLNRAFIDQSILQHELRQDDFLHAYSIGYLLTQQGQLEQADKAFEIAEVTTDPTLRAITQFAIANVHFHRMMNDFGKERGSRRIVEQVILAREAYKAALRLKPDMYQARFNLELLDRLSPEKRTQGFKTGDGYTYQITPILQDGRMHMKDNTIRGLP